MARGLEHHALGKVEPSLAQRFLTYKLGPQRTEEVHLCAPHTGSFSTMPLPFPQQIQAASYRMTSMASTWLTETHHLGLHFPSPNLEWPNP